MMKAKKRKGMATCKFSRAKTKEALNKIINALTNFFI
jgi:hypothetical protein